MSRFGIGVMAALLGWCAAAGAQESRYELGRRVRVMERAWERATPEARRAATPALERAVRSFFGMRMKDAGRAVAEATWALQGVEPSATRRWAASLWLRPSRRLVDRGEERLRVRIEPFYDAGVESPIEALAGAWLRAVREAGDPAGTGGAVAELVSAGLIPRESSLPLDFLGEGDHRIELECLEGRDRSVIDGGAITISVVNRLRERLEAARAAVAAWGEDRAGETIETATARGMLDQLTALADGEALETDVPAARRMGELEGVIEAVGAGREFFTAGRDGDFWMAIPVGEGKAVAARVFVPGTRGGGAGADAEGESAPPPGGKGGEGVPLVVALHGAGGSENMFFDSYGDGKIVRLCEQRGWMLVAPRGAGRVEEVVEALAARYPVDRSRVYLVGHSMGAMGAVGEASRRPGAYAAVAALGGGGRIRASEELKGVRFFVGVGSEDFALGGARGLKGALERAGVASVTYREYEGIEHLAVVQAALGEVFDWLEGRGG